MGKSAQHPPHHPLDRRRLVSAPQIIVAPDTRGRVAIAKHVKRNGVAVAPHYVLTFGTFGAVILTPIDLRPVAEGPAS